MAEGYYKPRKTVMTPDEIKKAQAKKTPAKNKPLKSPSKPEEKKITKTPPVKPKQESKPKNTAGGYSKRITYPKEELKPVSGGIQKGGGKIGGYIKPKTVSYNSTKGVIWALLIIFVVAIIFGVLYFTNTLNDIKIGGIGLGSQDLEMKISSAQIENDSVDLKLDIEPGGEELIGVKIIVDDGINFDVFKVDLTKEEIEKGEIHLELDKVDGDRINKILISPITNTKEREGVVGSVEESYIPKKTDFVNQRDLNNYNEPNDIYYPSDGSSLKNQSKTSQSTQTQNQTSNQTQNQTINQTNTNQTLNNQTQDNNQTQENESEEQNTTDYSNCNKYTICYQEAVFEYNACTTLWSLKQECSSEEVCMTGECILRTDVIPECGNGILEVGEYCEEGNLAGETCQSFGYSSGTLICNPNCAFDLRYCSESDTGCTPDCQSNECGDDGCGGSCGDCTSEEECLNGQCEMHACDPLPDACDGKECGSNGCSEEGCGTCSSEEECNSTGQCVPELINEPCWFIENNQCDSGADEVTCDRDIIYTSLEACEQDLIPEGCSPLETNEYSCVIIEESDPGYNTLIQGGTACGPCVNDGVGEVVYSEGNYYCKCLTTLGIK